MSDAALYTVIGTVLTALVTVAGSVLVAWIGRRAEREQSCAERLDALEDELDTVKRLQRVAAHFIDRIGLWLAGGQRGPAPRPPKDLDAQIDPSLWGEEGAPNA